MTYVDNAVINAILRKKKVKGRLLPVLLAFYLYMFRIEVI
jgi:hypothetical protein